MAEELAYAIACAVSKNSGQLDMSFTGTIRSSKGQWVSDFGGAKPFISTRPEFKIQKVGSANHVHLTPVGKKVVRDGAATSVGSAHKPVQPKPEIILKSYGREETQQQIKNALQSNGGIMLIDQLRTALSTHQNKVFQDVSSLKSFVANPATRGGILIKKIGKEVYVEFKPKREETQQNHTQPAIATDQGEPQQASRRTRRSKTAPEQSDVVPLEPILVNHDPQNDLFESMIMQTPNGTVYEEKVQTLEQMFLSKVGLEKEDRLDSVLLGHGEIHRAPQRGVLGSIVIDNDSDDNSSCEEYCPEHELIHLNTHHPFCLVALGVQGSGKSHSMATVIESCMLHAPPYIHAKPAVTTMVFHYDQDPVNYCEALTLTTRRKGLVESAPVVDDMIVLVSPSFYLQRKAYYAKAPNCRVLPLLFKWSDLNAAQIKNLMRVDADDNMPLYMNVILDLLRKAQKSGEKPSFEQFKKSISDLTFNAAQNSALAQRLQLIESLLDDSAQNKGLSYENVTNLIGSDPRLIIIDLTDPMMSGQEANGIFQVVLSKFLSTPTKIGKLALFDEAHKYLQPSGNDGLSSALVSAVRQMRHHGIRIAVSTQSPKVLPPELLELLTVALIHRFHSRDWFTYLQAKLSISDECFREVMELRTGQALAFTPKWGSSVEGTGFVRKIQIRSRLTADGGVSKVTL